jgi:uncharacterized membrane protein YgcG
MASGSRLAALTLLALAACVVWARAEEDDPRVHVQHFANGRVVNTLHVGNGNNVQHFGGGNAAAATNAANAALRRASSGGGGSDGGVVLQNSNVVNKVTVAAPKAADAAPASASPAVKDEEEDDDEESSAEASAAAASTAAPASESAAPLRQSSSKLSSPLRSAPASDQDEPLPDTAVNGAPDLEIYKDVEEPEDHVTRCAERDNVCEEKRRQRRAAREQAQKKKEAEAAKPRVPKGVDLKRSNMFCVGGKSVRWTGEGVHPSALTSRTWCEFDHGVCCSNLEHCCPPGTVCSDAPGAPRCVSWDRVPDAHEIDLKKSNLFCIRGKPERWHGPGIHPDAYNYKAWCEHNDGVCCPNLSHCCPSGFYCAGDKCLRGTDPAILREQEEKSKRESEQKAKAEAAVKAEQEQKAKAAARQQQDEEGRQKAKEEEAHKKRESESEQKSKEQEQKAKEALSKNAAANEGKQKAEADKQRQEGAAKEAQRKKELEGEQKAKEAEARVKQEQEQKAKGESEQKAKSKQQHNQQPGGSSSSGGGGGSSGSSGSQDDTHNWKPAQGKRLAFNADVPKAGMYSYVMWLKPLRTFERWMAIFQKGEERQRRAPAVWFIPGTTQLHVRSASSIGWNTGLNTEDIPLDKWTHVAITHEDGELKVYFNGELNTHLGTGEQIVHRARRIPKPIENDGDLWASAPWYEPADVWVADFRMYSRILPESEVRALVAEKCYDQPKSKPLPNTSIQGFHLRV